MPINDTGVCETAACHPLLSHVTCFISTKGELLFFTTFVKTIFQGKEGFFILGLLH